MSKKAFNITVEPKKAIDLRELTYWLIARHVISTNEPNIAFDVIRSKIRSGPRGFMGYGIKVFPK